MKGLILKTFPIITLILAIFLVNPLFADAAQIRSGAELDISESEEYQDNTYIAGGNLNIQGNFQKDLLIAGGEINFSGDVAGDLLILGGKVKIEGSVLGDVRVIGGEIDISGEVLGDLIVAGGKVLINEEAFIQDNSILVAGEINQLAPINSFTKIVAANVYLNDEINDRAEITTQYLKLGGGAKINSDFYYYAPQRMLSDDGATITGNVSFNEIKSIRDTSLIKNAIINWMNFYIIFQFVTTLLVAFIMVYIFKVFAQESTNIASKSFLKSLLAGLGFLILIPILSIILMVSLVGMPIGIILILWFIFVIIIKNALAGIVAGTLLQKLFKKNPEMTVTFQGAVIGTIALIIVQFIPFIGFFAKAIFSLVAIGATYLYFYQKLFKHHFSKLNK